MHLRSSRRSRVAEAPRADTRPEDVTLTEEADFDPLALTAYASLNRVVVGDFGDPEMAGKLAVQACSRNAMLALAAGCGLTALRPDRLADDIGAAAASSSAPVAEAATEALTAYGRRLGTLIATLRDPRTPGDQARSRGHHACLSYWLAVDSIWLGGGLMAGGCGPVIQAAAQQGAAAAARPCRVLLTPYPVIAPLLGAALHGPAEDAADVVAIADLGHSTIKTAVAERHAAAVTRFWPLDVCPAPEGRPADEIEDALVGALGPAIKHAAHGASRPVRVIVSVASFVSGGLPADDGRGSYSCLASRGASFRSRLSADSGADVSLEFVHDGTAAAQTAGAVNSATITAGTSLGCGFRPAYPAPSYYLAPGLRVGAWVDTPVSGRPAAADANLRA